MSHSWPTVPLGEALSERRETPAAEAITSGQIRVIAKIGFDDGKIRLRADGHTKTGMILVRPGDLVVSGINAAKGAIALHEDSATAPLGATIHYAAYMVNRERAEPIFLWLLLRSAVFRDLLKRHVPGGIKTELKPKRLLQIPVPLPPLMEQRRLSDRIHEIAAKLAEAGRLRQQAAAEAEAFVTSLHYSLAGERTRRLGEVVELAEDAVPVTPDGEFPQVGLRSFGMGLFPKGAVRGSETTYKRFHRLYAGALVLSQVKGWEGAIDVCGEDLAGWFASPEYRTFKCIPSEARPDYLAAIVRTAWFRQHLQQATRGVGARRERTRPEQFVTIEIPMPDVNKQQQAEAIFRMLGELKKLNAATTVELNALLPSILDRAFKGEFSQ